MRSSTLMLAAISISAVLLGAAQERRDSATPSSLPRRDLSGIWLGQTIPPLEPTAPMTPKGQALFDAAKPMYGPRSVAVVESNDPIAKCDPFGFPRSAFHETRGMEFIQTPRKVVQLLQYQRVWREIWTDGRSLPADVGGSSPTSPDARRYGYSIGRWEDDFTFVVQTTGAMETSFATEYGHPHGLHARIEERYRRIGPDVLELTVTIDDPEMYQRPFVAMKQDFRWGTELDEQLCIPSEAQQYLEVMAKPAGPRK